MGSSHGSPPHSIERYPALTNIIQHPGQQAKHCPNNNLNQGKYGLNLCSYYYMINVLLLYDNI
ncbi:hypothetical protein AKO1_002393 [Acrasis kona]|uniref:Uncharacterized protein n=1 Tax=Acrasis kona TaxID=1008807 RepID=A0AAW2ZAN8_9EUKA